MESHHQFKKGCPKIWSLVAMVMTWHLMQGFFGTPSKNNQVVSRCTMPNLVNCVAS